MGVRSAVIVLAGALCAIAPAVAQTADLPPARERFRVGFAELLTGPLEVEHRLVGSTFPRLLYEALREIDERDLSREERLAEATRLIDAARVEAERALTAQVTARDRLLFDPRATAAGRTQAAARVRQARDRLDALLELNPSTVGASLADRRPVVFWPDHEAGRLLASPTIDPLTGRPTERTLRAQADAADLDLLIWGTAQLLSGYVAVDIYAYHRHLDWITFAGGTVALAEEIGREVGIVAREVAGGILGRPFASLTVFARDAAPSVGEPPAIVAQAEIRVDSRLRGYGSATAPFLRPGTVTVAVRSPGYVERVLDLAVSEGEPTALEVELVPRFSREVRIESSPSQADVYVDSVWAGRTPLVRPLATRAQVVYLRKEGYLESRFVLDPASPPMVARALLPDTIDWSTELRERRDVFYRSLSWFVISVPVTVLLRGAFDSILGAFPPFDDGSLDPDERLRLGRLGNVLYWSSLGSLMVNAGLLVNVVISLADYVRAGEGSHSQ